MIYQQGLLSVLLIFLCHCLANMAYGLPVGKSYPKFIYAYPAEPVISLLNSKGEQYRPVLLMAEAMFEKSGFEWKKVPLPLNRMYSYLDNGKANISISINTHPALQDCCITSEKPIYLMHLGVYQKDHSPPITSFDELIGKTLIVIDTYTFMPIKKFLDDPKNNITLLATTTHDSAFAMLEAKRGDYFLDYLGPAKKADEEKERQSITYSVLKKLELFIILRKDYPDAENIIEHLAKIYRSFNEGDFGG